MFSDVQDENYFKDPAIASQSVATIGLPDGQFTNGIELKVRTDGKPETTVVLTYDELRDLVHDLGLEQAIAGRAIKSAGWFYPDRPQMEIEVGHVVEIRGREGSGTSTVVGLDEAVGAVVINPPIEGHVRWARGLVNLVRTPSPDDALDFADEDEDGEELELECQSLRQQLELAHQNVEAVIKSLPQACQIRCCEGGGLENLNGSLALSISATLEHLKKVSKNLSRITIVEGHLARKLRDISSIRPDFTNPEEYHRQILEICHEL